MTTPSTMQRNFPTLRYLAAPFRWTFASRRRALTASVVLLAMLAAPLLWRSIALIGLPDVGDPVAYRPDAISDDQNAYVLYQEAIARLKRMSPSGPPEGKTIVLRAPWSKADPRLRAWVGENREALEFFRRGSERPDAISPQGDRVNQDFRALFWLAMLEASRLEERGEMAAAWDWYRAALRGTHHLGRRGTIVHRMVGERLRSFLLIPRLVTWSSDPRTTPAMVRRALEAAFACDALTPVDADTIRREYPDLVNLHDGPHNPGREELILRVNAMIGRQDYRVELRQWWGLFDAWRWWRREPERSRRVIRLAIANWLAYYELPTDRRPPPDPEAPGPFEFYTFGPEAPADARALSTQTLGRWMQSSIDARPVLELFDPHGIRRKERLGQRALVVLLASELYRRDHRKPPPREEDLVGPYLKALPDDGLGDAGGATDRGGPNPTGAKP